MRRLLAHVLVVVLAIGGLVACTRSGGGDKPALNLPPADDTVAAITAALQAMDVSSAPLTGSAADAQDEVKVILSGMDGFTPATVTAGPITYASDQPQADVQLTYTWNLPSGPWTYEAPLHLVHDQNWAGQLQPSVIHPDLDAGTRLVRTRQQAKRGPITGNDGKALVEEHAVVRVGIDKMQLRADQLDTSARALAAVLGLNGDTYAKAVSAAGAKAFVLATTLRQGDVPGQVAVIPGAVGLAGTAMLGPTSDFANEILGSLGEASPEVIAASKGAVAAGDIVGVTGLQRRYEEQLRGTPGDKIQIVARRTPSASPSASPSGSATPSASASGSASASRTASASPSASASIAPKVIHSVDPVAGKPLVISLDLDLQLKAEQVMSGVAGAAAIAVVRPSTGAVLAAANSPGSAGQPDATFGKWAPGSTMKIATSLALIRKGYTPESMLNCSATATLSGQSIKNYTGFPSAYTGRISLATAVAESCNTAFVNEHAAISADDLVSAAASLGLGQDYDAGATISYGEVPKADSEFKKAQEFIGQGGVLANPTAMAGVAASVSAGKTVVPWIVAEKKPQSTAAPLSAAEAQMLQSMMAGVVSSGSGSVLAGLAVGAKTGTAQYGTGDPLPTHAWIICYTSTDLAVAVWVKDGGSGSSTAGPLVRQLLG